MAKELLSPQLTSGYTYYSLIFSKDGQVFNGTTFEEYVDANYSTYAVAMTELGTSSGIYAADLPGALSASTRYSYIVLRRSGGAPAITDTMEAQGVLGPDDTAIATAIADAILSRNVSNVETTAGEHTLCTVVLAMLENSIAGSTLTIRRTDGATPHVTKTLSTSPNAEPIVGIQ